MRTIHKITLEITDEQTLEMGKKDEILKIGEQNGRLCVWFLTHKIMTTLTGPRQKWRFYIFGTGHEITCKQEHYVDTVQIGAFVWHVYMRRATETVLEDNDAVNAVDEKV